MELEILWTHVWEHSIIPGGFLFAAGGYLCSIQIIVREFVLILGRCGIPSRL